MQTSRVWRLSVPCFCVVIAVLHMAVGAGPQDGDQVLKQVPSGVPVNPLDYLPDGTTHIMHTQISAALKIEWFKQIVSESPVFVPQDPALPMLKPVDIESITGAGDFPRTHSNHRHLVIIKATREITEADLSIPQGQEALNVGRHTIRQTASAEKYLCLLNSRTILRGSKEVLQEVLQRDRKPMLSDEVAAVVARLDLSKSVYAGVMQVIDGLQVQVHPLVPQVRATDGLKVYFGTAEVADNFQLVSRAVFKDDTFAAAYRAAFLDQLAVEKSELKGNADHVSSTKLKLLEATQIVQAGNEVVVSTPVPAGDVAIFLQLPQPDAQQDNNAYKPRIVDVYYYDLGTGELFLAKSNEIPPIDAPSGPGPNNTPQGVRAYVFSCGDCSDKSQQFVGWLEMFTPDAKRALSSPPKPDPNNPQGPEYYELWARGHLVSVPGSGKWVQANSEEGFKVMESIQSKCGPNIAPKPCFPGSK